MNLLEHQSKALLRDFGVMTPRSVLIKNAHDLSKIKAHLFPSGYVVKAQVATGGRGKSGGVKLVDTAQEAKEAARAMLGSKLTTYQSGGNAVTIESVLVAEKFDIDHEYYLAILLNRRQGQPTMLLSRFGGMDIEEVAQKNPQALLELPIDPWRGLPSFKLRQSAISLEIPGSWIENFISLASQAAALYQTRELGLLEINPLAQTPQGFVALDAKIGLEENALFRQSANKKIYDKNLNSLGPLEKKARALGVSYVPMSGQIGCLVNGAGLAMATMDLIAGHGQQPANFLDVGGGANPEQLQGAFEILFSDKRLKAVFVNIFGGILRCDLIAQALLAANKKSPLAVPLVARLLGNRVEEARHILSRAKLNNIEIFNDLTTAVRAVCRISAQDNHHGHSRQ
ncbi:MAG: ADP-forming succinate--CoA ligase subunit beta [Elusimicrobia bacterium]|nr:ADP-forming succinate--CoA ligase subunit beta [Elusimicrobiota bacterium]